MSPQFSSLQFLLAFAAVGIDHRAQRDLMALAVEIANEENQ